MPKKPDVQEQYEAKYNLIVKVACLITLLAIILIDASNKDFEADLELELALVAAVAGLELREKVKKYRSKK